MFAKRSKEGNKCHELEGMVLIGQRIGCIQMMKDVLRKTTVTQYLRPTESESLGVGPGNLYF